jgi:hypothetical protein
MPSAIDDEGRLGRLGERLPKSQVSSSPAQAAIRRQSRIVCDLGRIENEKRSSVNCTVPYHDLRLADQTATLTVTRAELLYPTQEELVRTIPPSLPVWAADHTACHSPDSAHRLPLALTSNSARKRSPMRLPTPVGQGYRSRRALCHHLRCRRAGRDQQNLSFVNSPLRKSLAG